MLVGALQLSTASKLFPGDALWNPKLCQIWFSDPPRGTTKQVMVMAGADPRPSYAPCLVEMSTVYDGFLFLVSNSCTRDFKLPGFLFYAASLVSNPQSHPLPSPEMLEPLNQTFAQPGRRVTPNLIPSVKLGFSLLGLSVLGPLRLLSLLSKAVLTERPLLLTRFERNSNLFYSSQYMCRFMEPFVRRLHLESKSPLLLAWLGIVVENLFLDRQTDSALEASNLNELGIMIQTFWRCDYRCIFKHLPSPFSMLIETFKLPFINLMKYPSRNLKTNGIMTPSPWSGCYHYSPRGLHRSISASEPLPPPGLQPIESLPRRCFCFCPLLGELCGPDSPLNVTKSFDCDYLVSYRILRC